MATHSSILAMGKPMGRGAWQAKSCGRPQSVVSQLDTTEGLNHTPAPSPSSTEAESYEVIQN